MLLQGMFQCFSMRLPAHSYDLLYLFTPVAKAGSRKIPRHSLFGEELEAASSLLCRGWVVYDFFRALLF